MRYEWKTGRRVLFAFLALTLGSAACDSVTAPDVSVVEQLEADDQVIEDSWADRGLAGAGETLVISKPAEE